jgi:LacI family sucrose operon transcriptional repressor
MSIKKIAELSGVSKSTVSRYLNGGYVSESNKSKIKAAIEKTGFIPSFAAQSLRTKVTKQIGVIIPKLNSYSISKMVAGITEILNKEGYYVVLANTENNEDEELKYLSLFDENHVDGIILLGTVITDKHKEELNKIKLPLVLLAQYHDDYPCVYFDNLNAAKVVTKKIIKGHSNPGMISARIDDISTGKLRQMGYFECLKEENIESTGLVYSGFGFEDGYEACKRLLKEHPEVDSIFCSTDHMACGAVLYLNQIGKKIPEDISVGCVGGSESCLFSNPRLTNANLQYFTSGNKAAELLLSLIKKENVNTKVMTEFKLDINGSTKND